MYRLMPCCCECVGFQEAKKVSTRWSAIPPAVQYRRAWSSCSLISHSYFITRINIKEVLSLSITYNVYGLLSATTGYGQEIAGGGQLTIFATRQKLTSVLTPLCSWEVPSVRIPESRVGSMSCMLFIIPPGAINKKDAELLCSYHPGWKSCLIYWM
jgi:hypothetical protein